MSREEMKKNPVIMTALTLLVLLALYFLPPAPQQNPFVPASNPSYTY